MNTPGENAVATAEHTLAMLLALVRRIPAADRSLKEGKWERSRFQGIELAGKTLGVVGLGRVGREVARRAHAFGMRILAHDPLLPAGAVVDAFVERTTLDALLAASDFVTLHVPLDAATHHLIDAAALSRMRPGAALLNCARGGLVDETALCDALDAGRLAGAALDVFETEPPGRARAVGHPQIVATPHLGGSTAEAQARVGVAIACQVADFLTRGVVVHAVNVPPLEGPWRRD
jgi:D-3-phosphoglycerate dehydrogenase